MQIARHYYGKWAFLSVGRRVYGSYAAKTYRVSLWKLLVYKEVECCREGVRRDQVQAQGRRLAVHDPYRLVPGPCGLVGGGRFVAGHPARIRSLLLFLGASDKASGMMYNREPR